MMRGVIAGPYIPLNPDVNRLRRENLKLPEFVKGGLETVPMQPNDPADGPST